LRGILPIFGIGSFSDGRSGKKFASEAGNSAKATTFAAPTIALGG